MTRCFSLLQNDEEVDCSGSSGFLGYEDEEMDCFGCTSLFECLLLPQPPSNTLHPPRMFLQSGYSIAYCGMNTPR